MKVDAKIDKNSVKYREYLMKKAALCKIVVFLFILLAGAIISLIIPLRPKESISEKRTLSKFPKFSTNEFLDGEYFKGVDTWFADTFPGREGLIVCSEKLSNLYGIRKNVIHGEVVKGDDIPDADIDESEFGFITEADSNEKIDAPNNGGIINYGFNNNTNINIEDIGVDVEYSDGTTDAKEGESLGSIFVVGSSAYNYYSFSQNASERYATMVNSLATSLKDKAKVYNMIVPTAIDITLDDATRNSITSSNQKKAMLYMYSKMNQDVGKCYIYDLMRNHRNEYIYFRTDHHWTALGAYYAYSAFMTQLGKQPFSLNSYTEIDLGAFAGSYYTQTRVSALYNEPDTVYAYYPFSTNKLEMINMSNDWTEYNIVSDVSSWNITSKYSAFIGGDNPFVVIDNPSITDGSACLIIKESFGNAFVPFVVENFDKVYVVDYRYYHGNTISKLVEEYGIQTVLMLNNISITSTTNRIEELEKLCQ